MGYVSEKEKKRINTLVDNSIKFSKESAESRNKRLSDLNKSAKSKSGKKTEKDSGKSNSTSKTQNSFIPLEDNTKFNNVSIADIYALNSPNKNTRELGEKISRTKVNTDSYNNAVNYINNAHKKAVENTQKNIADRYRQRILSSSSNPIGAIAIRSQNPGLLPMPTDEQGKMAYNEIGFAKRNSGYNSLSPTVWNEGRNFPTIKINDKEVTVNRKYIDDIDKIVSDTTINKYDRAKKIDKLVDGYGLDGDVYDNVRSYAGLAKLRMYYTPESKDSFWKEITQPAVKFFKGMYNVAKTGTDIFKDISTEGSYSEFQKEVEDYYKNNPDELGHRLFLDSDISLPDDEYFSLKNIDDTVDSYYQNTHPVTRFISDAGFKSAGEMLGSMATANFIGLPAIISKGGSAVKAVTGATKAGQAVTSAVSKVPYATKAISFLNPFNNPTTVVMGTVAAKEKYDALRQMGYDDDTALKNAVFSGYVSSITEKMGYDGTNPNFFRLANGASISGKATASGLKNTGRILKSYLTANVSEGLEEVYNIGFERLADKLTGVGYLDQDGNIQKRKIFGNNGIIDIRAMGESFLGGFVGGAVMGGVGVVGEIANMNISDIRSYATKVQSATENIKLEIEKKLYDAGITDIEIPNSPNWKNATIEEMNSYYESITNTFNNILNDERVIAYDNAVFEAGINTYSNYNSIFNDYSSNIDNNIKTEYNTNTRFDNYYSQEYANSLNITQDSNVNTNTKERSQQNTQNQTVNNNGQNTAKKADVVSWYDPSSDKIIAKSSAEAKNVIGVLAQIYPEVTISEMEKQIVHDETKKVLQEYINIGLGDEPIGKYFTDSLEVNTKVDTYSNTNVNTDSYGNVNTENNFNNTANTVQNDIPKAADFNPNMATNLLKSQGENGAKAFDTAFQNERAKGNNISRYDFLRYFNKYYAAALVGKSKSTVDVNYSDRISQSSAMAAYTAGVKDKALELENKIKAANNVIRQNGGVLINENSRLINNDTVSYINGVAKDLGVSVEFVDSIKSQGGQSVNGSYSDGTIKISMEVLNNPNAETDEVRNKVAESIFKHEITHRTQQLAPKQFERFRDLAYEYVSSKNSSNLTEVEKQLLKEYESGVDMNYSEAVDEIVADFVGSADFAEYVAVKDKNLAQKILDVIRDILDKIGVKKYSEMDNIARAWEKTVNAAEKNVNKANIGTFDKSNPDIRYSTKNVNELIENAEKASADTGKITKDMPDEERSKIISQKRITVPTYNKDKFDVIKDFDINTLKNTYKSKAFPIIETINKYFNITNKTYSNKDIDLDFEYSKASLNESMHKQHKDYDDFAKLLSVFDDVVKNAVGIEVHDDKYKGTLREDASLKNMYVMASAFKDGNRIVPVQLEVKNFSNKANKLYLTVTLDESQRNSDSATNLENNSSLNNSITVPSDISISDLVKSVNASNGKFLKYFPDSMLNSEQISAKQEALKADEERINQYRNGERPSYSSENSDDLVKKIQADLDILNKEYGSFEPGENAARDVRIPKQTTDTDYTRRFARTAAEAPQVSDEQAANIMNAVKEGAFSYNQITDAKAMQKAKDDFNENGYEGAIEAWKSKIGSGNALNKFDIAFGEYLMTEAAARNDSETFERVTAELAAEGTRNAQNTQAFRLLKKLGGAGQLIYVNRAVENIQNDLKKRYGKKAPNIEVSSELKNELARAKSQEAIDAATEKIIKSVAEQMPSTFEEKWNAWRYLAMLGNPRTHIRNIVGNGVFAPAVATKNIIATVLESGVDTASKITRGKGIERSKRRFIPKKYKDFAKTDYNMMEDIIKNGGKREISSLINDRRKILPGPIDKLRVFNENMLESEDGFFLKRYYKYALASYLAANKADIDTLNTQNKEGYKLLEKARNYAIKEAQKATYRDASSFATALNNFSRTNRATTFITESILPFKKTPANILKRGIEYSPLGLIDTITRGTYKLAKKQYTANEFIDGLSSGLSGTGIVALGFWLASMGILKGSSKDDKEEFEEMEGAQTYAVYSGNKSYTIDWAAPTCIPLFVGAELYRLTENDEKLNVSTVIDSLATLSEPIFEMSMLDGLNSVFEAPSKNPDDKAIVAIVREMITSYLGQAVPTILGQTTRTFFDDTRRRSYADKNSSIPAWAQYAYQKQANKIPGLSKKQEPYIDNWGREQKTGNIYERAFENYFSPGYYSEENLSDVDIELMRLAEQATEEQNVFPKEAVKYFDVDNVRKDLTAKEYTTFQTVKGQKSYKLISDIYNSEAYDDLTDEQRIDVITKLYEVANVVGKKSVSDYVSTKNWIEEAIEKGDAAIVAAALFKACGPDYASTNGMYTALDNGVDMGTYIEFLNKTKGLTADKDKNGKSINYSKQNKIKKVLQDMDATDEEKDYMYRTFYENAKDNAWK